MKRSLLPLLRCPFTGECLALEEETVDPSTKEILSGVLKSPTGRAYPVVDGIPVLTEKELFSPGQDETVESFSEKWKRAPGYREATKHHYIQWYLERYGFQTIDNLREFLASKRRILDAGTGHGRDALLYAENSAAEVFGLDISSGITLAYRDLRGVKNLHLLRADLRHPPFEPESFDFIACDQVIHHTPNTRESLGLLLRALAPGGHIAFYVYKVNGPIREFCDDYIRERTTQMTPEQCMEVSEALTAFGRALTEQRLTITVPVDIPLLGIAKGEFDLQRWLYWNVFKCYWNETIDWDSNVITNFDWYHPLHAHRHTEAEVRSWLAEFELEEVHLSVVESGISVLAKKRG